MSAKVMRCAEPNKTKGGLLNMAVLGGC